MQSIKWQKTFAKHLPGKGLLSKIYKGLVQIAKKKKKKKSNLKMGKGPE